MDEPEGWRRPRTSVVIELPREDVEALASPAERVRAACRRILQSTTTSRRLPMLPETAMEAISLANDLRTPMKRLEEVVSRDTALACRVLTVASSAAYGGGRLRTLSGALQRLGTGAIRDILYRCVMECHVFVGADRDWARVERDHAIAVARVARSICGMIGLEPEYAFVCGLLHDVGRVAMRSDAADPTLAALDEPVRREVEELVHPLLGWHVAKAWNLPPLVRESVRRHHRYRGFGPDGQGYSQIGHLVAAADAVCSHLGLGRRAEPLDLAGARAIAELGLDLGEVMTRARSLAAAA